jgi:hypothetical protein
MEFQYKQISNYWLLYVPLSDTEEHNRGRSRHQLFARNGLRTSDPRIHAKTTTVEEVESIFWHMGRFCNNEETSANILTATNTDNNWGTAVSMRRSVNVSPLRTWQQYGENCFSYDPRQASAPNSRTSIATQRSCKHAFLTKEDGVLMWQSWLLWLHYHY